MSFYPTPIFDSVMADQGHEIMPPPPFRTHEQFMRDHDHAEYLSRADAILRGKLDPKKAPHQPKAVRLSKPKSEPRGKPASVPVKKPR